MHKFLVPSIQLPVPEKICSMKGSKSNLMQKDSASFGGSGLASQGGVEAQGLRRRLDAREISGKLF